MPTHQDFYNYRRFFQFTCVYNVFIARWTHT